MTQEAIARKLEHVRDYLEARYGASLAQYTVVLALRECRESAYRAELAQANVCIRMQEHIILARR
jgi:hypothetical protein